MIQSLVPLLYCLRRGLRLKDGPGSARGATVSGWLRWGFTLSPSARTGPSRPGPAGEGRSDSRVLHLHPRGQARYPERGRRREDEPPREGWRVRANTEETSSTRATSTWRTVHAGARAPVPPVYGSGRPAFSPPTVLRGRGRIFPAPARGNPAPHGWRAISVPLALVIGGLSRSVAATFQRRPGRYEAHTVQLPKLIVTAPSPRSPLLERRQGQPWLRVPHRRLQGPHSARPNPARSRRTLPLLPS